MAFLLPFLQKQLNYLQAKGDESYVIRQKTKQQKIVVGCSCFTYWFLCYFGGYTAIIYFAIGVFSFIADSELLPNTWINIHRFERIDRCFATLGGVRAMVPVLREGLWGSPQQFAFMCGLVLLGLWCLHQSRSVPNTPAGGWQWTMWHSIWHIVGAALACYALHHEQTNGV